MRLIDADVLVEQLSDKAKEMLGIAEQCQGSAINYYTGAKYGFAKAAIIANGLPTIDADTDNIIQKVLEAGERGEEVRFYIGGRKFAVRELAQ